MNHFIKTNKKKKVLIIIPARLESTRLPNKVLRLISGIPMIVRVAKRAETLKFAEVIVASGNKEICNVLDNYDVKNILTSKKHKSGTDRIFEVYKKIKKENYEIIINLQGDLPIFKDVLINSLLLIMQDKKTDIGTAVCELDNDEKSDKNIVKAEAKLNRGTGFAKNFVREVSNKKNFFHHIGIYAYRPETLKRFVSFEQTSEEIKRGLEQMRALNNDMKIKVIKVSSNPISVDTIDDLKKIRTLYKKKLFN